MCVEKWCCPGIDRRPAVRGRWREIRSGGEGIGLIHKRVCVAELVRRLQEEYLAACSTPYMVAAAGAALAR